MTTLNSACNCCEKPPTNIWAIQKRSKSSDVGWCGFFNENDGKYYHRYIEIYEDPWQEDPNWSGSTTITKTQTIEYNPESEGVLDECLPVTTEYIPSSIITSETNEDGDIVEFFNPPYDDGSTFDTLLSTQYEQEITSSEVKQIVESKLEDSEFPEWNEQVNSPPFSVGFQFEYLSLAGFAQQEEFRIVHQPSATGYLKIWFIKVMYDWNQNEFAFVEIGREPFTEYVWEGSPPVPEKSILDPDNEIISEVFELPAGDGEAYEIYPLKWSMLNGYEPSNPVDLFFSGNSEFGNIRPDPDCFSNAFPTVGEGCPASLFI